MPWLSAQVLHLGDDPALSLFWPLLVIGVVGVGAIIWGAEDRRTIVEVGGGMLLAIAAVGLLLLSGPRY